MVSMFPLGAPARVQAASAPAESGVPRYGGTLRFLGPGGPDHLDTASAYYATSSQALRALTRQLFAYPAASDLSDPWEAFTPAADVAVEIPSVANGGLGRDRRVYRIRLRTDVCWDTNIIGGSRARAVAQHLEAGPALRM